MTKKVVVIKHNDVAIECCEIAEFNDAHEFLVFKKKCEENKEQLFKKFEEEKKSLSEHIDKLEKRIETLENESKYNRGEISEKEYNELCNG